MLLSPKTAHLSPKWTSACQPLNQFFLFQELGSRELKPRHQTCRDPFPICPKMERVLRVNAEHVESGRYPGDEKHDIQGRQKTQTRLKGFGSRSLSHTSCWMLQFSVHEHLRYFFSFKTDFPHKNAAQPEKYSTAECTDAASTVAGISMFIFLCKL